MKHFIGACILLLGMLCPALAQGPAMAPAQYWLLTNASSTGAVTPVQGGTYYLYISGTFGGATINLVETIGPISKTLGPYTTATGPVCVALPVGASVQMQVTGGAPSGLFSYLGGVGPGGCQVAGTPGISPENYGMIADGVCTPAGNPTSCTGTDNASAYNNMITALCALPEVQTGDIMTGRAVINYQAKNYYFHTSPNPIPCSGIVHNGQPWGGTVFSGDAGVNFIQFGTFSTTPANFFPGVGKFGGVYNITFVEPANSCCAETRTGAAITDNGAGFLTIQDVHVRQMLYGFNAPYGGQLDTVRRLFVEYTDRGIYCGPVCDQTTFEDYHCQFTWHCITLEGGTQVTFSGITDLNSCGAAGTSDSTGDCIDIIANQSTTLQGVWICPGTPGSPTGCQGFQVDNDYNFWDLWLESNNGALGYIPKNLIHFEGNYGDASRGLRVHSGQFVLGGSLLSGSAVVGADTFGQAQSVLIENVTYGNSAYASFWNNVSRSSCANIRPVSGSALIAFGVNTANTGCRGTPGLPYVNLTPGATVATDLGFTPYFNLSPAQNFTMNNPTNGAVTGGPYVWKITQDSTGSRIVTWASQYKFPGGAAVGGVLSTAPNAVDTVTCIYDGSSAFYCTLAKGFALNVDVFKLYAANDLGEADPLHLREAA